MPTQNLLVNIVTNQSNTYDTAVQQIIDQNVNAPCFVILANGGQAGNFGLGINLVKSRNSTDIQGILFPGATFESPKWYLAQTNLDVWRPDVKDPRFDKVIQQLEATKSIDPSVLVENVLNYPGVQTNLTIFAASMLPQSNEVKVYKT
jgi:hypothetical protein